MPNLSSLVLLNTFRCGVRFNTSFLSSLSNITWLELSIPDASFNLDSFSQMTKIERLKLETASFRDGNIERIRLSRESFIQLFSDKKRLLQVALSGFDIQRIDQEMLANFDTVEELTLVDNQINHLEPGSFHGLSSRKIENPIPRFYCSSTVKIRYQQQFIDSNTSWLVQWKQRHHVSWI